MVYSLLNKTSFDERELHNFNRINNIPYFFYFTFFFISFPFIFLFNEKIFAQIKRVYYFVRT